MYLKNLSCLFYNQHCGPHGLYTDANAKKMTKERIDGTYGQKWGKFSGTIGGAPNKVDSR